LVDINKETLRFYEKKGLLPKPKHTDGGYRIYDERTISRLKFFGKAKELGFKLTEV
jgi:MerR family mercuric resistance operon transcriptional regulator